MISVIILIHFLILHFLFDWAFQSDWMALNKSKSPVALFTHAFVATLWCMAWGWKFWLINFVAHALTDQTTSQWTSRLWFIPMERICDNDGDGFYYAYPEWYKRHWFFVAIGFDQMIHYITLILTWGLL